MTTEFSDFLDQKLLNYCFRKKMLRCFPKKMLNHCFPRKCWYIVSQKNVDILFPQNSLEQQFQPFFLARDNANGNYFLSKDYLVKANQTLYQKLNNHPPHLPLCKL
jgi:hypothetical protein